MGRHFKAVDLLPIELKELLDVKLGLGDFKSYADLSNWVNQSLAKSGIEDTISKSALHRYGREFQQKLMNVQIYTSQAREIANASCDESGDMIEGLMAIAQSKAMELLLSLPNPEEAADEKDRSRAVNDAATVIRTVGQLSRNTIQVKEYRRIAKLTLDTTIEKAATLGIISTEASQKIREVYELLEKAETPTIETMANTSK
jgi:hypothetical protein